MKNQIGKLVNLDALNGAKVKVVRESTRGTLTVEFLENRKPYKIDDQIVVYQCEFKTTKFSNE